MLLLQLDTAQAAFSQFVVITPQNEKEHGIQVGISPAGDGNGKYILTVPVVTGFKQTWFVLSRDRLDGPKQNLREYIWSSGREGDPGIVVLTSLHQDDEHSAKADANMGYAEILLDKEIIDRSYVFIDFPASVFDGGFYYSIDLGSYLAGPN